MEKPIEYVQKTVTAMDLKVIRHSLKALMASNSVTGKEADDLGFASVEALKDYCKALRERL